MSKAELDTAHALKTEQETVIRRSETGGIVCSELLCNVPVPPRDSTIGSYMKCYTDIKFSSADVVDTVQKTDCCARRHATPAASVFSSGWLCSI